ncbi:ABC-2 type transport system permease protein [Halogranum amylolyticum]|uniref:ABC-2 type transport system permease protein n=1 Tax=Halogranum amylolyticum TaxID=660520 RepID=A0A1H8N0U8_9EURY|nr:ABC transporter permease subunit [Halogranum amylolyticum]SEO23182.1 ABC-2 type transport system permease protein [Halogranum amylolyticum]
MFEITAFETRRRGRQTLLLSTLLVVTIGLVVGLYPSIAASGVDFEAYVESFPPEVRNAFLGSVENIGTVEGFLVTELYQFVWVLLLGIYFGYVAAGTIAGEIEGGSVDLLLVNPVSRSRLVVGKFCSLLPVVVVVNAVAWLAVLVAVALVDETVDPVDLFVVHALFVLYHAASASVGLLASVVVDRVRVAQGIAIAVHFGLYLVDSLTLDTDYEWLGDLALSRHFDVGELLVAGDVDWAGLGYLVVVTVVLVVASAELFERTDVTA